MCGCVKVVEPRQSYQTLYTFDAHRDFLYSLHIVRVELHIVVMHTLPQSSAKNVKQMARDGNVLMLGLLSPFCFSFSLFLSFAVFFFPLVSPFPSCKRLGIYVSAGMDRECCSHTISSQVWSGNAGLIVLRMCECVGVWAIVGLGLWGVLCSNGCVCFIRSRVCLP
jgi:hypothetical protein